MFDYFVETRLNRVTQHNHYDEIITQLCHSLRRSSSKIKTLAPELHLFLSSIKAETFRGLSEVKIMYVPTIQELVLPLKLLKNETGVISYLRKGFQKNQDILV